MVKRSCRFPGCTKPLLCKTHKEDGHVRNPGKKCIYQNCMKAASFGAGKTSLYCSTHKNTKYINVFGRKCMSPKCLKCPSFGPKGDKIPLFCKDHKAENHINIAAKRCRFFGCDKVPSFGKLGGRALYCKDHKKNNHVNVTCKKPCKFPECEEIAVFGILGYPVSRCFLHQEEKMIKRSNGRCFKCSNKACFGDKVARHCELHKEDNDYDLRALLNLFIKMECIKKAMEEDENED